MNRELLGSLTAKGGFANERLIASKFNNYKKDREAQFWLKYMGYDPKFIRELNAEVLPVKISPGLISKLHIDTKKLEETLLYKKADVQVRIELIYENTHFVENISIKKANSDADYNQIDKRSVDSYKIMWGFDDEIATWLKYFTGELKPPYTGRDNRRLFFNDMPEEVVSKIINFFRNNQILVACDVLKGRGALSADWFLVARYIRQQDKTDFAITNINVAIDFFGKGDVRISPKGSLYIGKITMQRKGGTPDPTKLQFKIKPCQIFELKGYNNGS